MNRMGKLTFFSAALALWVTAPGAMTTQAGPMPPSVDSQEVSMLHLIARVGEGGRRGQGRSSGTIGATDGGREVGCPHRMYCKPPKQKKPLVQPTSDSPDCTVWRAIRKAKTYGVHDPELGRLTNATIMLIGTKDGYKVRVEMDRKRRDCDVRRLRRI